MAGGVELWDLERLQKPVYSAHANSEMINTVDACGGQVFTSTYLHVITAKMPAQASLSRR